MRVGVHEVSFSVLHASSLAVTSVKGVVLWEGEGG
jgi:hypothetical protein